MNIIDTQARELLLNRRRAIRRLLAQGRAEENRPRDEGVPDWLDRAATEESAGILHRLSESERLELAEIDAALERIARGTYGSCEECGGAIGRQRLRAIPEARHCIGCEALARAS